MGEHLPESSIPLSAVYSSTVIGRVLDFLIIRVHMYVQYGKEHVAKMSSMEGKNEEHVAI